ncbi:spermatogenesis-associated protein 2-like protein isoform X2 [Engystomops pustulosus]|uniref:spermatogenesis-associated protein 2-like protein isoform X2 n=1 Tax=Engystomops pustulosus TaxID=76066 RepID=UPI003AFB5597
MMSPISRMSADSLLALYNNWLHSASSEGTFTPCTDKKTIDLVRQRILENPDLHNVLQNDAFYLIGCGLQGKTDLLLTLEHLAGAFYTLEQTALHLYFTPWRKEFQTIKTYSGHYVHTLETAFPPETILQALKRLNYQAVEDGTCLKIQVLPTPDILAIAALGFLAAQMECNILADLVSCSGSALVNGADLIRERSCWRGEDACMKRLQKLILEPSTVPVVQYSPFNGVESDTGTSSAEVLYQPPLCDHCYESWDKHVNGDCIKVDGHHPKDDRPQTQVPQMEFIMHDCVFVDKSLEHCCVPCHTFHSAFCSIVKDCRDKQHRVTQMTPYEKIQAVMEEQGRKHQLHCCLQPGHLPHYRCSHCRQLHYIKCERVVQCRSEGHKATMIMLEKDQQLWLQRSLMDLEILCSSIPVHKSKS